MIEFGSFDNSTCKRVLDLLEPGDLTLGQVVIKRVAVVELGVNNFRTTPTTVERVVAECTNFLYVGLYYNPLTPLLRFVLGSSYKLLLCSSWQEFD